MSKIQLCIQIAVLILCVFSFGSLHAEPKQQGKRFFDANPYTHCHILISDNTYTIVPKKSVLNFPERHKKRISRKPKGKFLFFKEFKAKNYGWLDTYKVTIDQSKGRQEIPEENLKLLKESGRVVIAVRENRAVPVLEKRATE
jgi:hypothetical protein